MQRLRPLHPTPMGRSPQKLSATQRLGSPSWPSIQHPPLAAEIPGCSHEQNLGPSTTRMGLGQRWLEEAKHAMQQHSQSKLA